MDRTDKRGAMPPRSNGCFSDEELFVYRWGKPAPDLRNAIFNHLKKDRCPDCIARYKSAGDMPEDPDEIETNWPLPSALVSELDRLQPCRGQMAAGQVWMTSAETVGDTVPVLIVASEESRPIAENVVRIMSMSYNVVFHREGYTVLLKRGNPLPNLVLVKIFDERPMVAEGLGRFCGTVSDADLQRILKSRMQFQEGLIEPADPEFITWKQQEIEAAAYLSAPVNTRLWDEDEHEIVLEHYRKAADANGIRLAEMHPHMLVENGEFTLMLLQIRDRVILRFFSDTLKPEKVHINGKTKPMKMKEVGGVYEAVLGHVDQMPDSMEISLSAGKETYTFFPRFYWKEREG